MFVQADPTRARSEKEKEELRAKYTLGENVIPKVEVRRETQEEMDDRRMVEEARNLSLRDIGIRGSANSERGVRHRSRSSQNEDRTVPTPHIVQSERLSAHIAEGRHRMEHQSSLRSLLSNSDVDSAEIEEEILRQIMDEGILDGIDITSLDISQEDELSERIAEAYRRRHGHRNRVRSSPRDTRSRIDSSREQNSTRERSSQSRSARSPRQTSAGPHSSHPPLSRPHLLEAYPVSPPHGRRTSSETRRQTSPNLSANSRASSETSRQAARSATDLSSRSQRPERAQNGHIDFLGTQGRRRTEVHAPETPPSQTSRQNQDERSGNERGGDPSSLRTRREDSNPDRNTLQNTSNRSASNPSNTFTTTNSPSSPPRNFTQQQMQSSNAFPGQAGLEPAETFAEPVISCNRCGRGNLQYELHKHCAICNDGNYDICLRCYNYGRGCLHWFGFGNAALQRYERQAPPGGYPELQPAPHHLVGRKYLHPSRESLSSSTNHTPAILTTANPQSRLQSGLFCSNCSAFATTCFWKCGSCNEGEWGFCDNCVRKGNCCSHPLLPVASALPILGSNAQSPIAFGDKKATEFVPQVSDHRLRDALSASDPMFSSKEFVPLAVSVKCAICTLPIQPSVRRFHCQVCQDGDYDIDDKCYSTLTARGVISADDGQNGWRKCPQKHRMIVVGFEDIPLGQQRYIYKDIVGGYNTGNDDKSIATQNGPQWKWHDQGQQRRKAVRGSNSNPDANPQSAVTAPHENDAVRISDSATEERLPPDGGYGMRVQAMWSYWPQEGATDELAFPKGAGIGECEDINGDWYWGIYCGRRGLFPGNFVRVIENVS